MAEQTQDLARRLLSSSAEQDEARKTLERYLGAAFDSLFAASCWAEDLSKAGLLSDQEEAAIRSLARQEYAARGVRRDAARTRIRQPPGGA